ncbi:hypothetical protein [Vibrio gigantis]|uniref:hypothetical protein n=2 Tax=Vibrio gigantis TaxID=296199 RepID=UPI001BFEA075|nr:hypothetical protein [Vibrio gigantis]
MKLKIALSAALLITSFSSHAELKMSINQQANGVQVTVYQDGKRVSNAVVTTNIRGQQTKTTDESGRAHFYRGSIPRIYGFEATAPDGESVKQTQFIGRDK